MSDPQQPASSMVERRLRDIERVPLWAGTAARVRGLGIVSRRSTPG
jgi:hypothetical protein